MEIKAVLFRPAEEILSQDNFLLLHDRRVVAGFLGENTFPQNIYPLLPIQTPTHTYYVDNSGEKPKLYSKRNVARRHSRYVLLDNNMQVISGRRKRIVFGEGENEVQELGIARRLGGNRYHVDVYLFLDSSPTQRNSPPMSYRITPPLYEDKKEYITF